MKRLAGGSIGLHKVIRALVLFLFATSLRAIDHTQPLRACKAGDYGKAFQFWMQAAKLGDGDAQYRIPLIYRDGKGVSKDLAEALRWLRQSAEHGFDPCQTELGWFLSKGIGMPTDHAQGVPPGYGRAYRRFLDMDASGDSTSAANNLGLMHERGWGRTQNLVEAGAWYSIAAGKGEPDAKEKRDEIMRRLSPVENYTMGSRARNIDFDRFLSILYLNGRGVLSDLEAKR